MKIRKPITLIVAFAMVFTVFGYGFTVQADAAAKKPTKMSISSNYKTVDIKGKVTVKVKSVSPANASKAVTWKSSNKNIATVSSSGVVTGKKAGTVKITATSKSNKKLKKTVTIKVKQIKPTLSLNTVYAYTRDGYVAVKASVPSNVYNAGVSYKLSSTKYAKLKSSKTSKKGYRSLKARTGYAYIAPEKVTVDKVTLTAVSKENKNIKKTCRVYVRQSVNAIAFDQKSAEAEAGKTIELKANATKPSKPYSTKLVYSSSDKTVATVDQNGNVTAIKPGTAKITATAKYGNRNKAKASCNLDVYDVVEPFNSGTQAEYTVDMDKYDYYRITGERNAKSIDIQLSNDELLNIVGKGDSGFNWMEADEKSFEQAEFKYSAGNDYKLEKTGNKVTVRFGEGNSLTGYYVAGKSFKKAEDAGDYTITLFTDETGSYKLQKIEKIKNKVQAVRGDKELSLEKINDNEYSIYVKRGTSDAEISIKSDGNTYKLILDKKYVENYKIEVKAFKK